MENNYKILPYFHFSVNEVSYLFVGSKCSIYKLNQEYEWVINNIDNIGVFSEEVIKKLIEINLIEDKSMMQHSNTELAPYINSITLIVNRGCNLLCSYCYEKEKKFIEMKYDDCILAINKFLKDSDNFTISFFGGEPLLSFGLINKIVNCYNLLNRNINYAITTNGTLINDNIAKFLVQNKFNVTISIDGTEEIHNKFRVDSNGKGSYNKAIDGLRLLKSIKPIIRSTITPKTLNIIEIVNSLYNEKIESIYVAPAFDSFNNKQDYENLTISFIEFIEYFEVQLKNKNYDFCKKCHNIISILKFINKPHRRVSYCDACLTSISVDRELNIYPCHRFSSNESGSISSVTDKDIDAKIKNTYNKYIKNNSDECNKCWAFLLCAGGCVFENQESIKLKKSFCKFTKIYMSRIIELYVSLTIDEKNTLSL